MLVKYMVMFLETMLQDVRDEAFDQGYKQGFAEGQFLRKLDTLKRLMKKRNMTLDEAMSVLEIPEDERSKYVSAIQKDFQ